ncbi:hypothetical protein GCM10022261_14010 [Brevibacterium daeguense]|uniref:EAL domain-containing protein n=1 Tax=Brevibacterium daeguense TaxID=909936 RepID=A0ABP8EJ05_9MICO
MTANSLTDPTQELERLVRSGLIDTYFSPVLDFVTGHPAGYMLQHVNREDGRAGHEEAAALRRTIRASELVGDFDSSLRAIGLRAAQAAGLPTHTRLFLTAEPESLVTLEDRTDEPDRSVILQLDPERIVASPAAVLRSMRQARSLGWGIGMKSIGLDLRSTAFLPLVNPSVVGLHEDVLKITDKQHLAELIRLLHAHTERTGAVIMVEGVSSEDDLELVRALGARFITGPLYGQSSREPEPVANPWEDPLRDHFTRNLAVQGTPFSIARGLKRDPLIMDDELLRAELGSLLRRALTSGESTVAIGVFGEEQTLSDGALESFAALRDTAGFTALLSGGFEEPPIPGVRTGAVDASDPLRSQYSVMVIGPDWSGMVAADRRSDPGPDGRIQYDVFVTTERYTCVDAARGALTRVRPLG